MNTARAVADWRSLFWTAFNLSANPMLLLQSDRVLVGVNDAFLNTFGYTRARALGRQLDFFVAERSRQQMRKDWWEVLGVGRLNGEREMVRADGKHVRAQFAAHREIVAGRDLVLRARSCRPPSWSPQAGRSSSKSLPAASRAAAQRPNRAVTTLPGGHVPTINRSRATPPRRRACVTDQSYEDGRRP
jgi:PAS domain S-box-containing protein